MPPKKKVCRQYSSQFLKYGFIALPSNKMKPMCLICQVSLSNDSMRENKVQKHLQSKHPNMDGKSLEFFKELRDKFSQRPTIAGCFTKKKNEKEKDTTGEKVILPSIEIANTEMISEEAGRIVDNIPLSRSTVSRRIDHMAGDIELQLVHFLRGTKFALQVDETTLKSSKALLMTYVRFMDENNELRNEMLFAKKLVADCKGQSIYDLVMSYMKEKIIPLENILSCATDGAGAMVGRYKGFTSLLKNALPGVYTIHCMVHRQHLFAKKLSGRLHHSLSIVIKTVNSIRSNALKDRLFQLLCLENEEDHDRLVLHTEVRWLSKGECMRRFVELWDSIEEFLDDQPLKVEMLAAKADIFYLSDIFDKLNMVNKQLQRKDSNLITGKEAITAFMKKLNLFVSYMKRQKLRCFPTLELLQNELKEDDYEVYVKHLQQLSEEMKVRFKDVLEMEVPAWALQPYETDPIDIDEELQESLIEMQSSESLKVKYRNGIHSLWTSSEVVKKFPLLWEKAELFFIAFPTSYLVETGFSKVTQILTRSRNRLAIDVKGDLRLSLTSLEPDLDKLVKEILQ